ncbi:MAG: hypothetical protein RLZZ528_1956 [Pseudomonadota bacterium]
MTAPGLWRSLWHLGTVLALSLAVGALAALWVLRLDRPQRFDDPVAAFKYGSTGGDRSFGIPYVIWQVLPAAFPEFMPDGGTGWEAFGFITDPADAALLDGHPRPVGTSLRNYQGIDRIFLNCAACHTGRLRLPGEEADRIIPGMPSNTVDLQAFQTFLTRAAASHRFTPDTILAAIEAKGIRLNPVTRAILRYVGIGLIRDRLNEVGERLDFGAHQPAFGPGRFDTFSSAKALFNWPVKHIPASQRIGVVDFPSIFLQGRREGMQLHWDGNNTRLAERDRSASFGTGATPALLDRDYLAGVEAWLATLEPPALPGVDPLLAAQGKPYYDAYCRDCHGPDGRAFGPGMGRLGTVIPISEIATDRARLDNYTFDLSVNQSQLYALTTGERFRHFRKTDGYAAAPLDGLWLRAPYLHNGAVPTLWDLLQPPDRRPATFWRGATAYDPRHVGFATAPPPGQPALCLMTRGDAWPGCDGRAPDNNGTCLSDHCPGNGNAGHDYGTGLPDDAKWQLIEYLKTF